jgi:hypothetical protein
LTVCPEPFTVLSGEKPRHQLENPLSTSTSYKGFFAPSFSINFFFGGTIPSPPPPPEVEVEVGEGAALEAALLLILFIELL